MTNKLVPTKEQQDIIDLFAVGPAKGSIKLKINAYAGASKTTTLQMIAEQHKKRTLYVTFNKSMATEAEGRFPSHVEVRTSHSVAYRAVGFSYQSKLSRPAGKYQNVLGTGKEVARHFKVIPITYDNTTLPAAAIGYCIMDTVAAFEHSADQHLSAKHVDLKSAMKLTVKKGFNDKELRAMVFRHANTLWQKRIDLHDNTLCRHDTYMKLYQLSDPKLDTYDTIFLDEAQDANPCLVDILLKQSASLVLVGDKYQSIYGFRGAINAMSIDHGAGWVTKQLTKSFRFGQNLADVATQLIQVSHLPVMGYDQVPTTIDEDFPVGKHYTKLFRTNAALVMDALDKMTKNLKVRLELDITNFVSILSSCLALKRDDFINVKHRDVQLFDTWEEFVFIAKSSDPELSKFAEIVESGQGEKLLDVLSNYRVPPNPDVTLTTAHRAKGLEYDFVELANDFKVPENIGKLPPAERNLIYVGFTRAKLGVKMNDLAKALLDYDGS